MPENIANPFDFIPKPYIATREEKRLAKQYLKGDFSGGYLRSQIAYFRMPKSWAHHLHRKLKTKMLVKLCARANRNVPDVLLALAYNNQFNNRIRHNTIWLRPIPALTPVPSDPAWLLAELFHECQGCGFWFLALGPGDSHAVVYCDDSLGTKGEYPNGPPDLTTLSFYQCADTLDDWLTYYFLDCQNHDRRYDEHSVRLAESMGKSINKSG